MFSCSDLALGFAFESAAILSLSGVNCIVTNQWNCKLRENKERLTKILEGIIDSILREFFFCLIMVETKSRER